MVKEKISLKDVFLKKLRDGLYSYLSSGIFRGYEASFIYNFAKGIIEEEMAEIDIYLQNNNVTLMNMDVHIDNLLSRVFVPYLSKKRIE